MPSPANSTSKTEDFCTGFITSQQTRVPLPVLPSSTPRHDDLAQSIDDRLQELRQSFTDDLRDAPAQETESGQEYLVLKVSGETYAYPVQDTLEIVTVPTIVPVPNALPCILGIINFRGQVLSIVSLHQLLGVAVAPSAPSNRILVTRGLARATGLFVDRVEGMVKLHQDDVQPVLSTLGENQARLLTGQTLVDETIMSLLDVEEIRPSIIKTIVG